MHPEDHWRDGNMCIEFTLHEQQHFVACNRESFLNALRNATDMGIDDNTAASVAITLILMVRLYPALDMPEDTMESFVIDVATALIHKIVYGRDIADLPVTAIKIMMPDNDPNVEKYGIPPFLAQRLNLTMH